MHGEDRQPNGVDVGKGDKVHAEFGCCRGSILRRRIHVHSRIHPSQRGELPEPRVELTAWFHGDNRLCHAAPSSTSLLYGPAKSALASLRYEVDHACGQDCGSYSGRPYIVRTGNPVPPAIPKMIFAKRLLTRSAPIWLPKSDTNWRETQTAGHRVSRDLRFRGRGGRI